MDTVDDIENFDISELPNSSFSLVLGKRRSGKSYMCEDLVKKLVKSGDVQCVFLFSGTDAGFDFIDKKSRFTDGSELQNIVDNHKRINDYNKVAPKKDQIKARSMVIIDDMAPMLKTKAFNILEELSVNGRHFAYPPACLHFMILCQSLTKIPRVVRLNADNIFMNTISSSGEREMIMDECLYILASDIKGKRAAKKLYHDIVASEPFLFMVIECHRQNVTKHSHYLKKYVADC